jgi:predicted DNA-binding ribbon-helix-helix protein
VTPSDGGSGEDEAGFPLAAASERDRWPALRKRSFSLSGHRTSVALEQEFWAALEGLAADRGMVLSALVAAVDAGRAPGRPLASALRVAALVRAGLTV